MAAKKYRARTIQEAIQTIKEEIGPDALILSTKRIPKGAKDPYGKDMFEVEAVAGAPGGGPGKASPEGVREAAKNFASALGVMRGTGPENTGQGSPPGAEYAGQGRPPGAEYAGQGRTQGAEYAGQGRPPGAEYAGQGRTPETEYTGQGRVPGTEYAGQGRTPETDYTGQGRTPGTEYAGQGRTPGTGHGEPTRAPGSEYTGTNNGAGGNIAPPQARSASPAGSAGVGAGKDDSDLSGLDKLLHEKGAEGGGFETIRSELTSIKEMLFLMGRGDGLTGLVSDHPEALTLYARLVKLGISEKRAQLLVGDACSATGGGKEEISAGVLKRILDTFDVASPFAPASPPRAAGKRYVAAFVGPTGVGKTTTIAKLAAELSLKQKRKVGLISVDSYRIGALEQLKTYAAIMGLPCLPAFNREDLRDALEKMKGREIILIDTAGHSHLDGKRMDELGELMGGESSISVHLVLSVTSGRMNMKEAAENFGVLNPESYVFTKVDETRIRGTVIEQVMDYSMPISYITNGQRVPEDLVSATKRNVLQFILN